VTSGYWLQYVPGARSLPYFFVGPRSTTNSTTSEVSSSPWSTTHAQASHSVIFPLPGALNRTVRAALLFLESNLSFLRGFCLSHLNPYIRRKVHIPHFQFLFFPFRSGKVSSFPSLKVARRCSELTLLSPNRIIEKRE